VQSDVTFARSYAEGPLELGKLMLYQLSYSRSRADRIPQCVVSFSMAVKPGTIAFSVR
jgi:hypothetical protein